MSITRDRTVDALLALLLPVSHQSRRPRFAPRRARTRRLSATSEYGLQHLSKLALLERPDTRVRLEHFSGTPTSPLVSNTQFADRDPRAPTPIGRRSDRLVVSAAPAPGAAGAPPVGAASQSRCRAEKGKTPENRTTRSR